HGVQGHSLWFERTANILAKAGMVIYAPDRRGVALNKTQSDRWPYTTLLSDISALSALIRNEHPSSPLILFGNCWGAKPAILSNTEGAPSIFDGLILTCPAIKVKCDVVLATKLKIAWHYITKSDRLFALPLTPEMFTENPQYLEFIRSDADCTKYGTAAF